MKMYICTNDLFVSWPPGHLQGWFLAFTIAMWMRNQMLWMPVLIPSFNPFFLLPGGAAAPWTPRSGGWRGTTFSGACFEIRWNKFLGIYMPWEISLRFSCAISHIMHWKSCLGTPWVPRHEHMCKTCILAEVAQGLTIVGNSVEHYIEWCSQKANRMHFDLRYEQILLLWHSDAVILWYCNIYIL